MGLETLHIEQDNGNRHPERYFGLPGAMRQSDKTDQREATTGHLVPPGSTQKYNRPC